MDFLDDLRLRGDGSATGILFHEVIRGLVHDSLHLGEEFDHFLRCLLNHKLLDIGGKFVLLVGKFFRTLGMALQHPGDLFFLLGKSGQSGGDQEKGYGYG